MYRCISKGFLKQCLSKTPSCNAMRPIKDGQIELEKRPSGSFFTWKRTQTTESSFPWPTLQFVQHNQCKHDQQKSSLKLLKRKRKQVNFEMPLTWNENERNTKIFFISQGKKRYDLRSIPRGRQNYRDRRSKRYKSQLRNSCSITFDKQKTKQQKGEI